MLIFTNHNFEWYKVIIFGSIYFKDFKRCNQLMLNPYFKYVLIYQMDCYVFSHLLLDWSKKGFDYIGRIRFEDFVGNRHLVAKAWQAGNAGLTLQKIKTMIGI